MMELGYTILDNRKEHTRRDLRLVDDGDLHYSYFLGDVQIVIDNVDYSTNWSWVPVLDFFICTCQILRNVQEGKKELFEFTESDETLCFALNHGYITISASYTSGEARIGHTELLNGFNETLRRVIAEISTEYPEIRKNSYFSRLMKTELSQTP